MVSSLIPFTHSTLTFSDPIRCQITNEIDTFTDKVERNCHFLASGWNCMTHRFKVFPIRGKYRSIKQQNQLIYIIALPAGSREVTVAFNFKSERTVQSH
jgi:hypothetical protein